MFLRMDHVAFLGNRCKVHCEVRKYVPITIYVVLAVGFISCSVVVVLRRPENLGKAVSLQHQPMCPREIIVRRTMLGQLW